jgi:hypothetical protein
MCQRAFLIVVGIVATLTASVRPASSDPVVLAQVPMTLPFSINVASTSDNFSWLFGRPMQHGSRLSGRVVIDSSPSPDSTPDASQGNYLFERGRFEFDVPAGLTVEAEPGAQLSAFVADGHVSSRFHRVVDDFGIELNSELMSLQVVWTDLTASALTGDAFPTSAAMLSGFQFTSFQLIASRPGGGFEVLQGTSDPALVPEPSTMILTFLGGSALLGKRLRNRSRRNISA